MTRAFTAVGYQGKRFDVPRTSCSLQCVSASLRMVGYDISGTVFRKSRFPADHRISDTGSGGSFVGNLDLRTSLNISIDLPGLGCQRGSSGVPHGGSALQLLCIPAPGLHVTSGFNSYGSAFLQQRSRGSTGRSRNRPWGDEEKYKAVHRANIFAERLAHVCLIAHSLGVYFAIEQPASSDSGLHYALQFIT